MSNVDSKARIVAHLARQRTWCHFNERQRHDSPGFDQAIAELLAERRITGIEVNDQIYFQIRPR